MSDAALTITVPSTGREIDVSRVLPLTIGDIKALAAKGINIAQLGGDNVTFETLVGLLEVIFKKACPDITDDEIDSIPMDALDKVMRAVQSADEADPTTPVS